MGTALQVDQELVLGALLHVEEIPLQGKVELQGKWRRIYLSFLSISHAPSAADQVLESKDPESDPVLYPRRGQAMGDGI